MNARMQNEYLAKEETNILPYVAVFMVIVLVGFAAYKIFFSSYPQINPVCGNGICEAGEGVSCKQDCIVAKTTVFEAKCGDGDCVDEERYRCCDDCGCDIEGQFCNSATHLCEFPDSGIPDDIVEAQVIRFFATQGKNVLGVDVGESIVYRDLPAKSAVVEIEGERTRYVIYTQNGDVVVFSEA